MLRPPSLLKQDAFAQAVIVERKVAMTRHCDAKEEPGARVFRSKSEWQYEQWSSTICIVKGQLVGGYTDSSQRFSSEASSHEEAVFFPKVRRQHNQGFENTVLPLQTTRATDQIANMRRCKGFLLAVVPPARALGLVRSLNGNVSQLRAISASSEMRRRSSESVHRLQTSGSSR